MYAQFFGLKQEPFSIAPDPRYLFMSDRHREALAHLLYGLNGGGGFVLLTGEIGAGKTTVCRCFLEKIPRRCNVAYIFNPKLTALELLKAVCEEFHITVPEPALHPTVSDYLRVINEFLIRTHSVGQNNVLIIDEAQNLSADVLEQLRLLTNLETNERKLLQIILIGQPELRDLLAQPELEQLAQRIIARFHLEALSAAETSQYIRHRLLVAGMKEALPFDGRARRRIHELTRGVPRRINLLCDRSLLGAYANGQTQVDHRTVNQAAKEVFYTPQSQMPVWHRMKSVWAWSALLLGMLLMAGAGSLVGMKFAASPTSSLDAAHQREVKTSAVAQSPDANLTALAAPAAGNPVAHGQGRPPFLTSDFSLFSTVWRSEGEAWQELASLWGVSVPSDQDPCLFVAQSQIQCYRGSTTLTQVRRLDRPVIVRLRDASDRPVHALLMGLGSQSATLRMGGQTQTVSLVSLAALWRGEFATLWRTPPGFTQRFKDGQAGVVVDHLAAQLATYLGEPQPTRRAVLDGMLRSKLSTFQIAQGLTPDGIPGPTTFMHLNLVAGVDEPRLMRSAIEIP